MPKRIYLDHAATTPMRPEVLDAMAPFLDARAFGNPSSLHADGQRARRALDDARSTLAEALHAEFSEVTFTSGGTEADNAAIVGVALANQEKGNHIVTTQIEHEAVLRSCRFLETLGFVVTYVPPNSDGLVSVESIAEAMTPSTLLVSVMHANNEVGTIMPITEMAGVAHGSGTYFHTDAVQSFGHLDVRADQIGADLISVSSHKIYGPKGVGALYVRSGIPIEPLLHGGTQERERRAGTENVAGIAGFAVAVKLMLPNRIVESTRIGALRDRLATAIESNVRGSVLNGPELGTPGRRLPNNLNVSFTQVSGAIDAQAMLMALDLAGLSASSGSACSSGSIEPSHVLVAMGLDDARVRSAIRLTLGRETTQSEIDRAAAIVIDVANRLSDSKSGE